MGVSSVEKPNGYYFTVTFIIGNDSHYSMHSNAINGLRTALQGMILIQSRYLEFHTSRFFKSQALSIDRNCSKLFE